MPAQRPALLWFFSLAFWLALGATGWATSVEDRLAAARLELEIGIATEQRILAELERYRASGDASLERIVLYETYLDRVRQLTDEKRKIVRGLEQARQRPTAATSSGAPASDLPPPTLDIPEDRELDELQALQRELDQSIAAFDDVLLTEGEVARVQSELKMKQLAQEAAQAARGLRESEGGEGEGSGAGGTGMESGQSAAGGSQQAGEMDQEGGIEGLEDRNGKTGREGDNQETGGGRYREKREVKSAGSRDSEVQAGSHEQTAGAQDDDIVARQLREAAEKETDPVLKEKLWKEYEDYKNSL